MEEDFKFDLSVFSVSELKMLINIKSKKEFNNEEISFLNKFKNVLKNVSAFIIIISP